MGLTELVKYIRENFEKKYAADIKKGTYDSRDLKRFREDFTFARTYIRGPNRLDEGVDLVHSSLQFRKEIEINDLTEYSFDKELWDLGGMYFKNKDIEGKRIFWLKVKVHLKNASPERLKKEKAALIFGLEKAFNEAPLQQVVVLLDMTACGLANLDMDFVKYIVTVFKFYYPTFLGYILIYDMPWLFNAAWKVVKAWLNAEAASKIKFVTKADIQTYIKPENLPPYMGGTDFFVYEYRRGMASLPLYPEDVVESLVNESAAKEKKVHFQEAQEPSSESEPQTPTDHNANKNGPTSVLRNRHTPNNNNVGNRNNSANEKRSMKMPGFLEPGAFIISPADELSFQTQSGGDSYDIITLSNTLLFPVAYKVKTTSPEKFRVRPSSGIINPRKSEEVYIYLLQDFSTDVVKDKFLIMAMEVKAGASTDPNILFKEAPKDEIMQHKLLCSDELGKKKDNLEAPNVAPPNATTPLLAKEMRASQDRSTSGPGYQGYTQDDREAFQPGTPGLKTPLSPMHSPAQGYNANRDSYAVRDPQMVRDPYTVRDVGRDPYAARGPQAGRDAYMAKDSRAVNNPHKMQRYQPVPQQISDKNFGDDDIDKQVEQLEQQTIHMQRQLNLLLVVQFLTAFTLILIMLAYSCVGEELFTKFLALPFDFCNDPYGRKC